MNESSDHLGPNEPFPQRAAMERQRQARVVTFVDGGSEKPGGMCNCCGCDPDLSEPHRPSYNYQASICDSDGAYYAMLCGGCLGAIRKENEGRAKTLRDEQAEIVRQLLGDDMDGAQAMMDQVQLQASDRLPLGKIVMTQGLAAEVAESEYLAALRRHESGDWGDVCADDRAQNQWAVTHQARVMSVYKTASGTTFWIITEADRSIMTLLLPSEY